jgi:hypothetical protein
LKFLSEVWARRACAEANENELTTCGKNWGQKGGSYRKKGARAVVSRRQRLVSRGEDSFFDQFFQFFSFFF